MAVITNHATKRFKQRLGVHKADVNKNAKRALAEGLRHRETHGDLNKFVTALYFRNPKLNNIRLYNGMVHIFAGDKLVTVFQIPGSLQEESAKQQRLKEAHPDDDSGPRA